MSGTTHIRYEVLRSFRNRRAFGFTVALPLVIFYAFGTANRHALTDGGISFALYFMSGMAAYGALFAVFSSGGRIALDRTRGWTRQLRITPLRVRTYVLSKVLAAYLIVLPSLGVLYLAGVSLGVRLGAGQWLEMTGLLLVGLVPFVVMGIAVGHLLKADTVMPVNGGLVVFFALFGGAWGQFFGRGVMLTIVKLLPSFWLVQAGKAAVLNRNWPLEGWLVVCGWTLAMIVFAMRTYRRDTARV